MLYISINCTFKNRLWKNNASFIVDRNSALTTKHKNLDPCPLTIVNYSKYAYVTPSYTIINNKHTPLN